MITPAWAANRGGNPEATRALTGLSLADLTTVCDGLRRGGELDELIADLFVFRPWIVEHEPAVLVPCGSEPTWVT